MGLIAAFVLAVTLADVRAQEGKPGGAPSTQESASGDEPNGLEAAQDASDGQRTPPQVIALPKVLWPRAVAMPEDGAVEVLVVIGADGLGQLEACDRPVEVCDAIAAALFEAELVPARVNGRAMAARVRIRFVVGVAAPSSVLREPAPARVPEAARAPSSTPASEPPEVGAVARTERTPATARALELAEMREVPGAFGDPFRVIDTLPGVVPVITGLPYVFVRGAPPAATAYFYDGIQLPALFHLALGPAVVHPAMVGPIDFYAGVAPARYGRKTGGVVAGKAAYRPLRPGLHGELELRLIDAQAYVAKPLDNGGRIEIGGRYGYPGLALKIASPTSVLQYWDYQTRIVTPVSPRAEVTIVALGSFDLVGERKNGRVSRNLEIQFHRVEARLEQRRARYSLTSALGAGYERSGLGENLEVSAFRIGPKLWLDTRVRKAALRFGADMLATSGRIYTPQTDPHDDRRFPTSANPIYRFAAGRNVIGAYGELIMPLAPRWELEAGLRGDTWITGGVAQVAAEPRALVTFRPVDDLALHAAAGLAYQPAVFLIPLPGLSDVSLDGGLQRAIQTELGGSLALPASLSIESKLFVHRYSDMLLFERPPDCNPAEEDCSQPKRFPRFSAVSYGSEWLVRRDYKERVSGWVSYTLAKAVGESDSGRRLTPTFDVRHVGNLVVQWRIDARWHLALRGYGQSGRFPLNANTELDPRKRRRLPPFFRGDLQLARVWQRRWGELRMTLDWLNFTFQRDPFDWECPDTTGACRVNFVEFPITLPMLGVRGSY